MADIAIAVSGGVDSMTLAHVAHGTGKAQMFHAISPAVPPLATQRVKDHASQHNWSLHIVGAGEFEDPDYLKNPVNRCYFCKTNLYGRLRAATDATICSGTNTDDLGDFRPGLRAADEKSVRHPFVEAGINKSGIRAIAATFGLEDIADLPAQPCLASRVETGLPILADQLELIDGIERQVADAIGPGDIRARMTRDGIRLEVPEMQLAAAQALTKTLAVRITAHGHRFAGITPYKRGSAFLRELT
jgi:uncharacterized protein